MIHVNGKKKAPPERRQLVGSSAPIIQTAAGDGQPLGSVNVRFPLILNPGVRLGFVIQAGLAVLGLCTEGCQRIDQPWRSRYQ